MIATNNGSLYTLIPPRLTEAFEHGIIQAYYHALPNERSRNNAESQKEPIPELLTDIMLKTMNFFVEGVLWKEYNNDRFLEDVTFKMEEGEYKQRTIERYWNDCLHPNKNEFRTLYLTDIIVCLEKHHMCYRLRHMNGEPWDVSADIHHEALHNVGFVPVW